MILADTQDEQKVAQNVLSTHDQIHDNVHAMEKREHTYMPNNDAFCSNTVLISLKSFDLHDKLKTIILNALLGVHGTLDMKS